MRSGTGEGTVYHVELPRPDPANAIVRDPQ
jgi:hypothetical protein